MSASVEVKGMSGLIANVRAADRVAQHQIRATMRKQGELQRQRTEAECPKDTGFMASHTRLDFTPEGLGYSVGYKGEDFASAGLPFYPPFVILGTSRMSANDFLFRVHEQMSLENAKAIGSDLRASYARMAR